MPDPEGLLREGLARMAEEVDTAVPLARRARARGRRRARRLVLATAVAVLVVTAGVAGALQQRSGPGGAPSTLGPAGRASDQAPAVPGGYRLEVWRDVGVYVPATWGWGGTPGVCGAGPTVGPDGHRLTGSELTSGVLAGYVGRPVAQLARCPQGVDAPTGSGLSFLWFDAETRSLGTASGGAGATQSRTVAGTTVTVGGPDPALRRSILASAHKLAGTSCPAGTTTPPTPSGGPTGTSSAGPAVPFAPTSMTVCAYAPAGSGSGSDAGSGYGLLYEEELPAGPAKELVAAVGRARPLGAFSCFGASGGEWALLRLAGGGQRRDYVVDLSCPSIADPGGVQHTIDAADVLPWAVDGVNAVLHGSPLIDVPGRLIGP